MGLNKAVMVVGGEGRLREVEARDKGDAEFVGSWNEGGVASGSVVNRIPVETDTKSAHCIG